MKNKGLKQNKGITLIALVITIIVILILAGVSINTLFGDNGMLTKAEEAREANSHAQVKDEIQLEMHNYEIEKRSGNTTVTLIEYLESKNESFIQKVDDQDYYVVQPDKVGNPALGKGKDKTTGDVYVIEKEDSTEGNITKIASAHESDIKTIAELAEKSTENEDWLLRYYKTETDFKTLLNLTATEVTGTSGEEQGDDPTVAEAISEDKSYIGYYADLDGDGNADGIIYADLAVGSEGDQSWNNKVNTKFQYSKITNGLNKYVLEEKDGEGFGEYEKEMIKVADSSNTGADRFYVMALDDVDENTHTWYKNGYGKLNKNNESVGGSVNDFGKGKEKTTYWMTSGASRYGGIEGNDVWKVIEGKLTTKDKTWFVPSKAEWSAFGYMCYNTEGIKMSTENYGKFGLKDCYWSSSLDDSAIAWGVYLNSR